ncbi:HNH endonuclease signature motif containing protein [Frigoribacterium sp. PvP054]|uniref:HNH endonuclease n=1 Tax=Frigoribacterium sp. PvP054 TaxID=3156438 RepID=UPI003392F402
MPQGLRPPARRRPGSVSAHHRTGGWTSSDSKLWRQRIAATLPAPCTICGRPVTQDMAWQVDHIQALSLGGASDASNLGPAHRACNAKAGGRMGAAKTNSRHRHDRRLPNW